MLPAFNIIGLFKSISKLNLLLILEKLDCWVTLLNDTGKSILVIKGVSTGRIFTPVLYNSDPADWGIEIESNLYLI